MVGEGLHRVYKNQSLVPVMSQMNLSTPHPVFFRAALIFFLVHTPGGPGSSVGIATELRTGRSGDRIPVGARFSARPDRPWGPFSLLYNGYRVFPGG